MSLPSIKVALPVMLVAWGVGAVLAGMWPLLVYPVMWAAVAGVLYGVTVALGGAPAAEPAEPAGEG